MLGEVSVEKTCVFKVYGLSAGWRWECSDGVTSYVNCFSSRYEARTK